MRTRRRKTKRRRRRKFYKRRRQPRRTRRRRRGRIMRGKRRGGSGIVGTLESLLTKGKGRKKGRGKSTQLPVRVLCDSVDAASDLACEVIGLGPEDPLADVCAYEMTTHMAKWCKEFVSKHEPSALKRILNNPLSIVKKFIGKRKGSSVLSSMQVESGHTGVEI